MKSRNLCVTKIFTFDSAHSLENYIGKCSNIHGHTYKLEVTFKGFTDENGLVIDFHDIDRIVCDDVLEKIDHKNLNDVLDFNTTCENVGLWIWDETDNAFKGKSVVLEKIVLWETPTNCISINREDMKD
jgi:6-pyruvoyltetrahydropterin/6-carboxytetrahydropterin synthase